MIEIQVVPEGPKALEVEAEGWWNDDHDVYTWPVRVGKWGAKIECHGRTPMEAKALALHVVTAIGAISKNAPAPEIEAPTSVGALILGGAVSSTELGDNDITLDSQVVERIQRELVKDSEDLAVELMLVDQHYHILQALRAERDAAQARVADIEKALIAAGVHVSDHPAMERVRALLVGAPVAQAGQVPEEMRFEYRHPNGERHTVTVSRQQVIDEMPDFLFEALCGKFCNCAPVGETNVVECCCDEYAEEFQLVTAAAAQGGE